jgi:TolB protein
MAYARILVLGGILAAGSFAVLAQQPPPSQPPAQQPGEIRTVINGVAGQAPKWAVPDFIAGTGEADTKEIAALLGKVLWDDLAFEREFQMIPRSEYGPIPAATSLEAVPFDRWRELGADGVVIGSVRKDGTKISVTVRVYNVSTQQVAFSKEYSGGATNPRFFAHTVADELHKQQRGLDGVARTKLAFASDRDGERIKGPIEDRTIREVYISDYDGENQRRITVNRSLNITPVWSPDGKAIAYTSYRRNNWPDIFVSYIYEGRPPETPAHGTDRIHNFLPVFSSDGTRIAFMSNRDGNMEIYVMNRDGSNVRRITNHPGNDSTPTWSPAGNQIAFTSDRSGSPQIYVADADGLGSPRRITTSDSFADRATWSPFKNEIAYAGRTGPGFDIKLYDFETGETRLLTHGEGSNESPAYAPNGRHIAFASTRSGKTQIFTIGRDGNDLRQITKAGNNYYPNWSH